MEEKHRNIIRQHRDRLLQDIVINEKFLSRLQDEGIFPFDLVESIRAVTDKADQGYKMVELLQKRGPKAFHKFVRLLETDYDWLAERLKGAELTEMSGDNKTDIPDRSQPTQKEDHTGTELAAMAAPQQKTSMKIMSSAKQDALAEYSEVIAKIVDVNTILLTLKKSLSFDEKQDIENQKSEKEKLDKLLNVMSAKEDNTFDLLISVLRKYNKDLANQLEEYVADAEKHSKQQSKWKNT